jgi:FdrA protein
LVKSTVDVNLSIKSINDRYEMASGFVIRKNQYYDSVFLMGVNQILSKAPGVEQSVVLIGTEANKRLLADIGFVSPEIDAADPNDLIVAVIAESAAVVEDVINGFDETLKTMVARSPASNFRTLDAGISHRPDANLAVFSIPGEYVADEARKALEAGLNVFIFSSNVPLDEELELKQLGKASGLLVMGPDCGTSIIRGLGIGFSNAVRRGTIGVVGPSGTGLQEFTSQVHNAGGGISHAIGTGGNDLSDKIGGLTTLAAMQALEADPQTEVIAIIAKPPGAKTLASLVGQAKRFTKPLIGCFLGSGKESAGKYEPIQWAYSIDDAVELALRTAQIAPEEAAELEADWEKELEDAARAGWSAEQKYLRGVFAGGTFCYQAQQILWDAGIPIYSNGPIQPNYKLDHPDNSREHTMVDMGDEHYTLGKPHPMIDGTERAKRIVAEAEDPSVAILLLDFILGYNASNDPVGELLDALQQAKAVRSKAGGELTIVASICGTREDRQDIDLQTKMLKECGAFVFHSNARAADFCQRLLDRS